MTVKEFIEILKELPPDATIGISEFWYLNNTGYDEIAVFDKSQIFIEMGIKDLDYYLVGKHKEWENENGRKLNVKDNNQSS